MNATVLTPEQVVEQLVNLSFADLIDQYADLNDHIAVLEKNLKTIRSALESHPELIEKADNKGHNRTLYVGLRTQNGLDKKGLFEKFNVTDSTIYDRFKITNDDVKAFTDPNPKSTIFFKVTA